MEQLDQSVVALAKAVREKEGNAAVAGQSGEYGNYQYTPDTWKAVSQEHLGRSVPLEQATIQDQNEATYRRFKAWKDAGYNPGQIASMHNAGEGEPDAYTGKFSNGSSSVGVNKYGVKYDVPSYAKDVAEKYQQFKQNTPQVPAQVQTMPQESGATFEAKTGEGAFTAGMKTLGNVPKSLFNFAKGAIDAINPISTIGRLAEIPGVVSDIVGQGQKPGQLARNLASGVYESVVPQAGRELLRWDTEAAQRSITNDPIGSVAPFVLAGRGAAGLADSAVSKGQMRSYVDNIGENTANRVPIPQPSTQFRGAFDQGISRVGAPVAKVVGAPLKLAGNVVGKTADFAVKQATGLSGETRKIITENPEAFTNAKRGVTDRTTLADTIKTALDERISSLGESQAAYKPIRADATPIKVNPNFMENAISETAGVKFTKGKIKADGSSTIREARDIASLQQLYNFWNPYFKKGTMTPDIFLNFRQDLAKVSGYGRDIGKSKPVENVTNVVRGKLNTAYRNQIKGLEELDAQTSSQIKSFAEVKKGILDKNNQLTEGAINRIANATNKGRDAVLEKLEEASPGIGIKIRIVKAIEDIENASENKVGTYGRAAFGAGSLLTVNIPGIIATILAQPEVAVPILRQYGFAKPLVQPVLKALKDGLNKANTLPSTLPAILPAQPERLMERVSN